MAGLCAFILAVVQCNQRICNTQQCIRAAEMMIQNRNPHQNHCQNFYKYACDNFRNAYPQTETETNVRMFDIQANNMIEQIASLLSGQEEYGLSAVRITRSMYMHCLSKSHRSTATVDCVKFILKQYPRVVLYLLATPEIYVEREKVLKIAQYIRRSFIQTIQDSWLDDNAKAAAVQDLTNLTMFVGFTEDMIQPENLLQPYLSSNNLFDITSRFDRINNKIFVPIAALTFPTNQLGLEALNFAGIGFAIAHEMCHKYDIIGRRMAGWWRPDLENIILHRIQCLKNQYNQFTVQGVPIGDLTLEENFADNVGFQLILDAYRLYADENEKEKRLVKFENYSHEKLFMLALANVWCENATEEFHVEDVRSGHAPAPNRINGMLMNSPDFVKLWKCPPNSRMNPSHKCNIWTRNN